MAQKNPVMASVREVLEQVGFEYRIQMGSRFILDTSPEYFCVCWRCDCHPTFGDDTDCPVRLRNVLSARRADLARVAGVLQEKGATLKNKQEVRGPTVDEVYHFVIEGQDLNLVLLGAYA